MHSGGGVMVKCPLTHYAGLRILPREETIPVLIIGNYWGQI
jgi:hypothetical protein